jgi:nucleoside-diphosphate-sugar epimerase
VIVGNGLLARAFEPHFGTAPDVIVFASGVSNSMETRSNEFAREHMLLRQSLAVGARRLVYFGSCGVTSAEARSTPYMIHKESMEALVLSSTGGLVLRLPQVVGISKNTHTLTNFLHDRILSEEHFVVWARAERNLIDIDDIAAIGSALAMDAANHTLAVSIAAKQSMPMPEIVKIFERVHGKTANYSLIEKGGPLAIDTTIAVEVAERLGIDLGEGYIEKVIRKYYLPC